MTIATWLPQWLRLRFQRSARTEKPIEIEIEIETKTEAQVQPAKPDLNSAPRAWQDDSSPPGYRVLWRQ